MKANGRWKSVFVLALLPLLGAWSSSAWEIAEFTTDLHIQADSSLEVTETIIADFSSESRHGIFRTIPVQYHDKYGNGLALRLRILGVTDGANQPLPFVETGAGRYRKVRIGSPDITVSGRQTYRLHYRVDRAITFFDDHDELYWNATGNEWDVPIRRATATITVPTPVGEDKLKALAFTGAYGATTGDALIRKDAQTISYEVRGALRPLEGLTIVAGWTKGIVTRPSFRQRAAWFTRDNWPLGLPVLTAMFLWFWWFLFGRDPRGRGTIAVQYEPPAHLTPAEIGTVIDEHCDMRDISATIIDLAVRGYLEIRETKRAGVFSDGKDYQFVKLKPFVGDSTLCRHERLILDGILGSEPCASLSSLCGSFYNDLPEIREAVYKAVVRQGYFPRDPRTVRAMYRVIGGLIAGVGAVGAFLQVVAAQDGRQLPWSLAGAVSVAVCGIVVVPFARILPRKTPKGARAHEDILGFEEYLTRAESAELQSAERQSLFEKFLPYAVALGVTRLWAKRFEDLALAPPSWYRGADVGGFSPGLFAVQLGNATSSMNSSLSVAPRSSGGGSGGSSWAGGGSGFSGGFSGGGGGGGGGGAW